MQQTNPKIFVVDDDPFCTSLYEQYLLTLGYTDVTVYHDGQQCLNALTNSPAIIFLDYQMEPYDGISVLKKIKRFNPDIFLVLVSGQDDMQVAINALKYGAFDYIIKNDAQLERMEAVLKKIDTVSETLFRKPAARLARLIPFFNFV